MAVTSSCPGFELQQFYFKKLDEEYKLPTPLEAFLIKIQSEELS